VCVTLTGSGAASVQKVTKIAGSLEVEIKVSATFSSDVIKETCKRGIADALGVPMDSVVKLEVIESSEGAGARRLQSTQLKQYEISYEVMPPSTMNPKVVVQKASAIFVQSTPEAQAFRQALTALQGVVEIRAVVPKISARQFEDEIVTERLDNEEVPQEDADEFTMSPVIFVSIAFIVFCSCLVIVGLIFRAQRTKEADQESWV